VLDIPGAFSHVASEVRAGTFKARVMELGIAEGIVSIGWNQALESLVPAAARAHLDELQARIVAGELEVPVAY